MRFIVEMGGCSTNEGAYYLPPYIKRSLWSEHWKNSAAIIYSDQVILKRALICFQVIWYMLSLQNGQWTNNQGQISECIAALENCHHYFFPYELHVTVYWCDESPLLTMYYTFLQRIVDSCISKPFVDQPKLQINDLT